MLPMLRLFPKHLFLNTLKPQLGCRYISKIAKEGVKKLWKRKRTIEYSEWYLNMYYILLFIQLFFKRSATNSMNRLSLSRLEKIRNNSIITNSYMKFADISPVKQRKRTEKSRFASQISRPKPVLSKLKSVGNESQSFNIVYAN